MIVKYVKKLPFGVVGITLFPFIFIKKEYKNDPVVLNHEAIHYVQQRNYCVIFFYFLYILDYLINLVRYRNHHEAYRNICFELEAYTNEKNMNYLNQVL